MHFINCKELVWVRGFEPGRGGNSKSEAEGGTGGYKIIKGDLVFDNCPKIATFATGGWSASAQDLFCVIEEIQGNVKINGLTETRANGGVFPNLKKVGGNFEISNCEMAYGGLQGGMLTQIGGDFVYKNNKNKVMPSGNYQFTCLDGTPALTVDGGAYIANNDQMPVYSTFTVGVCHIKFMKEVGYIKGDVTIVGIAYDDIEPCPSGYSNLPDPGLQSAIKNIDGKSTIAVYPTVVDSKGLLTVETSINLKKVEVLDLTGKTAIRFASVPAGKNTLDVSKLSGGVYLVVSTTIDNEVKVQKIVK
jgi:hypothetical protein